MDKGWWRWLVLVAFGLAANCGVARSQTSATDGTTTTSKVFTPVGGQAPGVGATKKNLMWVDGDGVVHMTEQYPNAFQASSLVIMSGVANSADDKSYTALSNPYEVASTQAYKWARITTNSGTAASPWRVQWLGSTDGITYYYLTAGTPASPQPIVPRGLLGSIVAYSRDSTQTANVYVDSDTLQNYGHGPGSWIVPLSFFNSFPITLKFIKCRGVNDTLAARFSYTIEVGGRQQ